MMGMAHREVGLVGVGARLQSIVSQVTESSEFQATNLLHQLLTSQTLQASNSLLGVYIPWMTPACEHQKMHPECSQQDWKYGLRLETSLMSIHR